MKNLEPVEPSNPPGDAIPFGDSGCDRVDWLIWLFALLGFVVAVLIKLNEKS